MRLLQFNGLKLVESEAEIQINSNKSWWSSDKISSKVTDHEEFKENVITYKCDQQNEVLYPRLSFQIFNY
jgi:hypothetical protein